MLNGVSINSAAINGAGSRSLVLLDSAAVVSINTSAVGSRVRRGSSSAPILVDATAILSATRFTSLSAVVFATALLGPSVRRSGAGVAQIGMAGSLFYTKAVRLSGAALCEVAARGDVGVVFIAAEAVVQPGIATLSAHRTRSASGHATVSLLAAGAASAVRRPGTSAAPAIHGMLAELDASHVDATGTSHVGLFGHSLVDILAIDLGMRRQALIGGALVGTDAMLFKPVVRRPTLSGAGEVGVVAECHARVIRRAQSSVAIAVLGSLAGLVLVPAASTAVVTILASAGPVAKRRATADAALAMGAEGELNRSISAHATAVINVHSEVRLARVCLMQADATWEVMTFGASLINPARDDIDAQVFRRPARPSSFARAQSERRFVR